MDYLLRYEEMSFSIVGANHVKVKHGTEDEKKICCIQFDFHSDPDMLLITNEEVNVGCKE